MFLNQNQFFFKLNIFSHVGHENGLVGGMLLSSSNGFELIADDYKFLYLYVLISNNTIIDQGATTMWCKVDFTPLYNGVK